MLIPTRDAERCHAASASSLLANQVSNCRHAPCKQLHAHTAAGGCTSWVHSCIQPCAIKQVHVYEAVHPCLYTAAVGQHILWPGYTSVQLMYYVNGCKLHHHENDTKRDWSTFVTGTCRTYQ